MNRTYSLGAQQRKMQNITPQIPESTGQVKVDLPDGKSINLPIYQGSAGVPMIDVSALYSKSGYFTIDPGYTSTGACMSTISIVDGINGDLYYRGYSIKDLAKYSTYMEVCYLLIYGELPSKPELKTFEDTMISEMMINEKLVEFYSNFQSDSHPMAIMVAVVEALSAFMHGDFNVNDPRDREYVAIKLVAKMPTLAAYAFRTSYGLPLVKPKKEYSFIKNFLYMMFSNQMEEFNCDPYLERVLDILFILHADHSQNASTSTVRIAGSSLANPFACIATGITALWGPYHGGANVEVLKQLKEIKKPENIKNYLKELYEKKQKLMGFGHRVYKTYDPRAQILKEMSEEVFHVTKKPKDMLHLAFEIETQVLSIDYFKKRSLYPNVDFYSGLIYDALDIPDQMFTVIFAVQRSIGWISHWSEQLSEKTNKISRPRQLYVGSEKRDYVMIQQREKEEKSRVIKVPMISSLFNLVKV